jgi:hypothetical protein
MMFNAIGRFTSASSPALMTEVQQPDPLKPDSPIEYLIIAGTVFGQYLIGIHLFIRSG